MWNLLKKDLTEFVSVVTGDAKEVLDKVLHKEDDDEDGSIRKTRDDGEEGGGNNETSPDVLALQNDSKTYTEGVDASEAGKWASFVVELDLGVKVAEIEKMLKENPEMARLHGELVGEELSSETFWTRYYYKLSGLKRRKGPLPLDLADDEEEELSWDDDDEEEEEGAATGRGKPPVQQQQQEEEEEEAKGKGAMTPSVEPRDNQGQADTKIPPPSSGSSLRVPTPASSSSIDKASGGTTSHRTTTPPPPSTSTDLQTEAHKETVALKQEVDRMKGRMQEMKEQADRHASDLAKEKEQGGRLMRDNEAWREKADRQASGLAREREQGGRLRRENEVLREKVKALESELVVVLEELEQSRLALKEAIGSQKGRSPVSLTTQAPVPQYVLEREVEDEVAPPSRTRIVEADDEEGEEGWEEWS